MNELIIEQKVREMILYGYIALRQLPRANIYRLRKSLFSEPMIKGAKNDKNISARRYLSL